MKKFGFVDGKGLGKQEQGTKDPIPFIKNNHTRGVGTKNVVHGMKQLGAKNYDKQVKYNTPIKFKNTRHNTCTTSKGKGHSNQVKQEAQATCLTR
jgi:hypothetical protein